MSCAATLAPPTTADEAASHPAGGPGRPSNDQLVSARQHPTGLDRLPAGAQDTPVRSRVAGVGELAVSCPVRLAALRQGGPRAADPGVRLVEAAAPAHQGRHWDRTRDLFGERGRRRSVSAVLYRRVSAELRDRVVMSRAGACSPPAVASGFAPPNSTGGQSDFPASAAPIAPTSGGRPEIDSWSRTVTLAWIVRRSRHWSAGQWPLVTVPNANGGARGHS